MLAGLVAPILTALPGLAGLFEDDELAFANVKSTFLRAHGHDAIVVEGDLVNTTAHGVAIPAIRISLRDARSEEVYSWLVEPAAAELDDLVERRQPVGQRRATRRHAATRTADASATNRNPPTYSAGR